MAVDFTRLTRPDVEARILRMLQDGREHEHRLEAIQAVNNLQTLLAAANKLNEQALENAVISVAGKLDVPIPAVPADLSTLDLAQLVALAQQMELAEWDYYKRTAALSQTFAYWRARGTAPTPTTYEAMFLRMANYMRAKRGLAAIA